MPVVCVDQVVQPLMQDGANHTRTRMRLAADDFTSGYMVRRDNQRWIGRKRMMVMKWKVVVQEVPLLPFNLLGEWTFLSIPLSRPRTDTHKNPSEQCQSGYLILCRLYSEAIAAIPPFLFLSNLVANTIPNTPGKETHKSIPDSQKNEWTLPEGTTPKSDALLLSFAKPTEFPIPFPSFPRHFYHDSHILQPPPPAHPLPSVPESSTTNASDCASPRCSAARCRPSSSRCDCAPRPCDSSAGMSGWRSRLGCCWDGRTSLGR